jgi:uncharacterized membrane protein YqaE (UPF0057 family)
VDFFCFATFFLNARNVYQESILITLNKITERRLETMGCGRILLAILLPPLAVIDKGCGAFLVVLILTLVGWIPGVIGALVIGSMDNRRRY